MEVSEALIKIKKYIKFVEYAKQWDSECGEKAYYDILNKMDSNENVYEIMSKKNQNTEEIFNKMCADIKLHSMAYWVKRNESFEKWFSQGIIPNKTEMRQMNQELAGEIEEYYYDLGKLMYETGMIDVLVERSNKAFDRIGASHFRITNEEAMKEFEIRKHNKTTYNILSMKVVFTINKVIKMMDSVCYAKMLENDRFNSNITNDRRIKLMSNLKTTFLQKALEYALVIDDEEIDEFEEVIKNEYERLFSEDFIKLNFKEDEEVVSGFEARKVLLYEDKTAWVEQLVELSVDRNQGYIKSLDPDLKDCGLIKDENGQWVLGMNVYGYPMPITVHVTQDVIGEIVEGVKNARNGDPFKVNKYNVLRDQNRKVFPSNVLFRANEKARETARKVYAEDKTDPIKKYLYSQIISKEPQDKNIEFYDETELR